MCLLKMYDGCYVCPDEVSELIVNRYGTHVIIYMKDGRSHVVTPIDGETAVDCLERIASLLNEGMT